MFVAIDFRKDFHLIPARQSVKFWSVQSDSFVNLGCVIGCWCEWGSFRDVGIEIRQEFSVSVPITLNFSDLPRSMSSVKKNQKISNRSTFKKNPRTPVGTQQPFLLSRNRCRIPDLNQTEQDQLLWDFQWLGWLEKQQVAIGQSKVQRKTKCKWLSHQPLKSIISNCCELSSRHSFPSVRFQGVDFWFFDTWENFGSFWTHSITDNIRI